MGGSRRRAGRSLGVALCALAVVLMAAAPAGALTDVGGATGAGSRDANNVPGTMTVALGPIPITFNVPDQPLVTTPPGGDASFITVTLPNGQGVITVQGVHSHQDSNGNVTSSTDVLAPDLFGHQLSLNVIHTDCTSTSQGTTYHSYLIGSNGQQAPLPSNIDIPGIVNIDFGTTGTYSSGPYAGQNYIDAIRITPQNMGSSGSFVVGESRCAFAGTTPVIPEAPMAAALPGLAAGLFGIAWFVRRRRRLA